LVAIQLEKEGRRPDSRRPPNYSAAVAFVAGWIIQLIGHAFEGKRPALADNLLQIFNAPLFLTVEVLLLLGFRRDLRGPVPEPTPLVSEKA